MPVTSQVPQASSGASRQGGRRAALARTRLDFWLDAAILAGYTVAYSYGFTGLAVHEWLGVALGLVLVVHLTLHWDWVVRTTRRLAGRNGSDRIIWVVNLALLLAMTLCVASGILASRVVLPGLGIFLLQDPFWVRLHILTAEITLGIVPVHVALRWRWIVAVSRRLLAGLRSRRSR